MRRKADNPDSGRPRSPPRAQGGLRSSMTPSNSKQFQERPRGDRWPEDYESSREPVTSRTGRSDVQTNSLPEVSSKDGREALGESTSSDALVKNSTVGAVHPSRLSNVTAAGVPGRSEQAGSTLNGPPRLKRPQSRFGNVAPEYGRGHMTRTDGGATDEGQGQFRPNSLLERLGMNNANAAGQNISLRGRLQDLGIKGASEFNHDSLHSEGAAQLDSGHHSDEQKGTRAQGRRSRPGRRGKKLTEK